MVTRSYMMAKPARPSRVTRLVHRVVVPAAINGLGAVEAELEGVAVAVRRAPLLAAGVAMLLGFAAGSISARRTA